MAAFPYQLCTVSILLVLARLTTYVRTMCHVLYAYVCVCMRIKRYPASYEKRFHSFRSVALGCVAQQLLADRLSAQAHSAATRLRSSDFNRPRISTTQRTRCRLWKKAGRWVWGSHLFFALLSSSEQKTTTQWMQHILPMATVVVMTVINNFTGLVRSIMPIESIIVCFADHRTKI